MGNALVEIYVNPLAFLEVDDPALTSVLGPVGLESIVRFLTTPGVACDVAAMTERYKTISVESPRLFAAPAEQRILEKLIWPLRHAKGSFVVGNYLGTISLCGMVAEMVAILLYELTETEVNGQPMDDERQRALFGSTFEKLSQDRRVSVLHVYGLIDAKIRTSFDTIRTVRRRYLHLWSQDHESLPGDAVAAFKAAVPLVMHCLGTDVDSGGRLLLRPALAARLAKQGLFREHVDAPASADDDP